MNIGVGHQLDNDKKQVIPRSQYRRKRREFFHNEEREERIKREREAQKQQVVKEQQQSKVNEERVKDNLRKARIEKLTQEEIQQQHELANQRQKGRNVNTNKNDTIKHSSTSSKSSTSDEIGNNIQSHLTSDTEKQNEVEDEQVINVHKEQRVPYSITNQPNDLERAKKNDDTIQQEQSNLNKTSDKNEISTKDSNYKKNNQTETSKGKTDKRIDNDELRRDSEQNKEKPYSSINNHSDESDNYGDKDYDKHATKDTAKTSNENDNFEHIKNIITSF